MTAETGKSTKSMIQVPKLQMLPGDDTQNSAVLNALARSEMLNSVRSANTRAGYFQTRHQEIDQFMMQFAEHSFTGSLNQGSDVRR